jgi:hypothetical protein
MEMKLRLTERARAKSRRNRRVARTGEFRRIEGLPRRDWTKESSSLGSVLAIGDQELRDIQEAALRECMQVGGLLGAIAVGKGKALISILAPVVLSARRPILLVPPQLREQTRLVLEQAQQHWTLHSNLRVIGYSELGLEKNAELLFEIKPDLIIADEVQSLRNAKSARTKRVVRYMREYPETKFVALSGSIGKRSIRDYAHIADWCLKEGSPLPCRWREQNDWADAIDEHVDPKQRIEPGALKRLCNEGEDFRSAYMRRLTETRGVIASGDEELWNSLQILRRDVLVPDVVEEALRGLRRTWETPGGELVTEASELWRFGRQLAAGFYYKWDPAPPVEWARARKAWKRYVTETLKHNRRNLDTELQIWNECAKPTSFVPEFFEWEKWKDRYKPNVVPVWLDTFLLRDAARWLLKLHDVDNQNGIVWTEHIAVGKKLAEMADVPYFGGGAQASKDILTVQGPIVASIQAHGTGKNLQDRYHHNLVFSAPSSGATWEQLLGRTHRPGQRADTVVFDVYMHTEELRDGFERALVDARHTEKTLGARQKLLYADIAIGENVGG